MSCGTSCAVSPTSAGRRTSRAHGGHCSRTPRTSPRPRPPSSPASAATGAASGGRYEMKEQFRAILAGDLDRQEAAILLDRGVPGPALPHGRFVKVARTMRERRDLILNAVEHGISNGPSRGSTRRSVSSSGGLRLPLRGCRPGPRDARARGRLSSSCLMNGRPRRQPHDPHPRQESLNSQVVRGEGRRRQRRGSPPEAEPMPVADLCSTIRRAIRGACGSRAGMRAAAH